MDGIIGSVLALAYMLGLGILSIFAFGDTGLAENIRLVLMPMLAFTILMLIYLYFFITSEIKDIEAEPPHV